MTIVSADGLSGFEQAIKATYPNTIVQRCIIHQIRSSTRYVSYKYIKELMKDLKSVYQAPNEEAAYQMLIAFEEKWGSQYPQGIKSWKNNCSIISPFFSYSDNIQGLCIQLISLKI